MVIKYFLWGLAFIALQNTTLAQCPTCSPDFTCGIGATFPEICPEFLPNGTTGEYYEQVITFFLPPEVEDQGITATLDQIIVTSITGLPFGLEITINDLDNTFYPNQGENYGCATLCGTPILAGLYNITLNAQVTVTAFGLEQVLNQSFVSPILVEEGESFNNSFSFDNQAGCDEVNVQFQALIDGAPSLTEYNWNFGNGSTSSLSSPDLQNFNESGVFTASLETTISDYTITNVVVTALSDAGDGDVDELFGALSPDPYLVVLNEDGAVVYTSSSIDDVESASFDNLSVALFNADYTIQIWDSDTVTGDDLLGEFSLGDLATGFQSFNNSGTFGGLTVELIVSGEFYDEETITVLTSPSVELTYDDLSEQLSVPEELGHLYQWYYNGLSLEQNSSAILASEPGEYFCIVTSEFGCTSTSETYAVCPVISIAVIDDMLSTTAGFQTYEWFYNGLPIPNSSNNQIAYQGAGNYGVEITTSYGCFVESEVITLELGIREVELGYFSVYPNPVSEVLFFEFDESYSVKRIEIIDQLGKVYKAISLLSNPTSVDLSDLPSGLYFLRVHDNITNPLVKSFVKE